MKMVFYCGDLCIQGHVYQLRSVGTLRNQFPVDLPAQIALCVWLWIYPITATVSAYCRRLESEAWNSSLSNSQVRKNYEQSSTHNLEITKLVTKRK
jgi:hypothetical protein